MKSLPPCFERDRVAPLRREIEPLLLTDESAPSDHRLRAAKQRNHCWALEQSDDKREQSSEALFPAHDAPPPERCQRWSRFRLHGRFHGSVDRSDPALGRTHSQKLHLRSSLV